MYELEAVIIEPMRREGALSRSALDARFAAHRPRLLAICRALVGEDAAEDVVQDTYVRARSHGGALRDPSALESWLSRIAVNACYNRFRSRRRLADRLPFLWRHPIAHESRDLGLRELIEQLSPRERTIVVLHYGYGYQLEEIAKLIGLRSGNVRSILSRTRVKLGEQLGSRDR